MAPLIGLKGRRSSGKDTIAKILVQDYSYRREAFADELKRELYEAFGKDMLHMQWMIKSFLPTTTFTPERVGFGAWLDFVDEHKNDPADSEFGWLGPMLQFWGTEYRRTKCGQDYWINKMAPKLGHGVVVSDVRFRNEADLIWDQGGIIVHVERGNLPQDQGARGSTHASEVELDSIRADYAIYNNGTLAALKEVVDGLYVDLVYEEPLCDY